MKRGEITIGNLFNQDPEQWGFRGDPYLWNEMRDYLKDTPLPDSNTILDNIINETFELLTGQSIMSEEMIRVERYDQGGMSSGLVSTVFWRETALPLILERYLNID